MHISQYSNDTSFLIVENDRNSLETQTSKFNLNLIWTNYIFRILSSESEVFY